MKALVTAFVSGLVFSVGLALGGMTDPQKVQGFLDIAGAWDPSLVFVMGGAVATHGVLRLLIRRRSKPVFAPLFPTASLKVRPDPRLLAGAALFGAGWGLSGYCPGPALTSSVSGGTTLVFVLSMLGGMLLFQAWDAMRAARAAETAPIPSPEAR